MARTWEQMTGNKMTDKAKFAEFRKLVENGILGHDTAIIEATKKASLDGMSRINTHGMDEFLDAIPNRTLNQSQLNAVVMECFTEHPTMASLDTYLKNVYDVAGYTGDKATMYAEAIKFAKEM